MNNINTFFIEIIPYLSPSLIVQNVPNKNQFGSVYFWKITEQKSCEGRRFIATI